MLEQGWPSLVLCNFACVVLLELGAALRSCWSLSGPSAFLLLRPLGAGVALHDSGRGGNDARLTLIVGVSIIVVVRA